MKILALGDTHLNQHGPGPAGWFLQRQADVLDQVAQLAHAENVDAVCHLGDIFERRQPSKVEIVVFQEWLRNVSPIPVYCIVGNHCHSGAGQPTSPELFSDMMTVSRRPEVLACGDVSLATLPWSPLSWLVAQAGGTDREELAAVAAEHLVDVAAGLREQIDGPAVLLAHWSVSGSSLPSGLPVEQLREVVLPLVELEAQDWDAVVLGHIHAPQTIGLRDAEDSDILTDDEKHYWPQPGGPAFYVGSPLPLNFGEGPTPHGCFIVEVGGRIASARFVSLDGPRFLTINWSSPRFAGEGDEDALVVSVAEAVEGAIVRLRGEVTEEEAKHLDIAALYQSLRDAGAVSVTGSPQIVRESRARVTGMDESLSERDSLEAWCKAEGVDAETHAVLDTRLAADLAEVAQ